MGTVKTGVSVPDNVMKEFEEISKELGYRSRSRAVQDAVQLFIAMNKWMRFEGDIAGCIVILYDHEVHDVEGRLTDVQHNYLDIISASMHVHLTKNYCLLIVGLKGPVKRVKELYRELASIRGILHVQPAILTLP